MTFSDIEEAATLNWETLRNLRDVLATKQFICAKCGVWYFTHASWKDGEEFICDNCARKWFDAFNEETIRPRLA